MASPVMSSLNLMMETLMPKNVIPDCPNPGLTPEVEARLRELIREETKIALKQHSESLGINSREAIAWQRRFAFLDGLYTASMDDAGWVKKAVRPFAVPAFMLALWEGVKHYLRQ